MGLIGVASRTDGRTDGLTELVVTQVNILTLAHACARVSGWPDDDCPYRPDPACTTPANCGAALNQPEETT